MGHAIIDRRKNDKGKSSVNRRKFINRVRGVLKESIKESIRDTDLKDLSSKGSKKVRIPVKNLDEPWFQHDGSGTNDVVSPGNDQFVTGDKIKRPKGGSGQGNKGSEDGEGVDSFEFHLTKEEFLELFFENCALPDMIKKNFAFLNEEEYKRQGFTSDGPPAALNIVRSMRKAKSRRFGLRSLKRKKLVELEEKREELMKEIASRQSQGLECWVEQKALEDVEHEIEVLKRRIAAVPFIDPMDLKYNHWAKVQLPSVQAVVFRIMDVSGSMGEKMKELAKTFFLLLELFLDQNYEKIRIVNIAYHSESSVVDDEEFFYGQQTGGTVCSKALQLAYEEIIEKFPTSMWNIYIAHASDGDNFGYDNEHVRQIITEKLLPLCQYYAYIQIDSEERRAWGGVDPDNLWPLFEDLKGNFPNLDSAVVEGSEDVHKVFVKLFEKKS